MNKNLGGMKLVKCSFVENTTNAYKIDNKTAGDNYSPATV